MSCAILLCAGYGTRMGLDRAKPLLEVGGRPMLDYLVDDLARLEGLESIEVMSNSRYAAEYTAWAADHPHRARLRIHDDGSRDAEDRLGAVGDLRWLLDRIPAPDAAIVSAGDNIYLFDIAPLWQALRRSSFSQVFALPEHDPARLRRTGVLDLGAGDRVVELAEKPAEPKSTWACPSIYALSGAALARVGPYLDQGGARDEIGRFVAGLVPDQPVYAVKVPDGRRLHVGNPAELEGARSELARAGARTLR